MARAKLDLGKCTIETGKSDVEYGVVLFSDDGNLLTSISVYKKSGMTEAQKKAILKKLKLALHEIIVNGV